VCASLQQFGPIVDKNKCFLNVFCNSEMSNRIKPGPPTVQEAIAARKAVINKASLLDGSVHDVTARSVVNKFSVDYWFFNETSSSHMVYDDIGQLKKDHQSQDASNPETNDEPSKRAWHGNESIENGVRWFHTTASSSEATEALGSIFGIRHEHFANAEPADWTVEFVTGLSYQNDYLRIAVNELKLLHDHDSNGVAVHYFAESPADNRYKPTKLEHPADALALEEVPLLLFLFPDLGVLVTFGTPNHHSTILSAARQQLLNRRSVLYREFSHAIPAQFPSFAPAQAAGPGGGAPAAGCGSLLVVLLDALMDAIFPVLDIFGDVIEGIQIINDSRRVTCTILCFG
jgi:hypothetical protein